MLCCRNRVWDPGQHNLELSTSRRWCVPDHWLQSDLPSCLKTPWFVLDPDLLNSSRCEQAWPASDEAACQKPGPTAVALLAKLVSLSRLFPSRLLVPVPISGPDVGDLCDYRGGRTTPLLPPPLLSAFLTSYCIVQCRHSPLSVATGGLDLPSTLGQHHSLPSAAPRVLPVAHAHGQFHSARRWKHFCSSCSILWW